MRAGLAAIDPRESSDSIDLQGIELGKLGVESQSVPIANVSYFATDHLAIELILSTPPKFDITGTTGLLKDVPIGKIEAYPLIVTAQYFLLDSTSRWQPFIGVGLNYIVSGDTRVNPKLAPLFRADEITIEAEDSWGITLAAGFDCMLTEKFVLSAQAYYMDIEGRANGKIIIDDQELNIDLFAQTSRVPALYSLTLGYVF